MSDLSKMLLDTIKQHRATSFMMPQGRVFLAMMPVFGITTKELLVVYEGGGSMVYAGDRPLNKFRLIEKGFPGSVAEFISNVVNDIVRDAEVKTIEGEKHE